MKANALAERFREWRKKSRPAKPAAVETPKPKIKIYLPWPEIIPDTKRAPGWMREAPAKPSAVPRVKRTARKSALTRIAEQLPAKLPRVDLPR